ncbi:MAG TPA: glutamate synthase subunit alpha, partial [Acidimicrobiales bacterium]|nr:glutamate synthase subunit alpha [Acidimicrobiales bacterium]
MPATPAPDGAARPAATGLYDPAFEHDACGIAMVADLHGRRSHDMVGRALTALEHLDHRGATGAEPSTGDGAGILVQMPDRFLREVIGTDLPEPGAYGAGLVFLPTEDDDAAKAAHRLEDIANQEGLRVVAWRDVPVVDADLGDTARRAMPRIRQVVVAPVTVPRGGDGEVVVLAVDRIAFCLRKRVEHEVPGVYMPSLSARTLVYKGMLTSYQLREFYPDLSDERFETGLALVHSRFSTNTFPSWPLAHPYRYLAHNGEINTL